MYDTLTMKVKFERNTAFLGVTSDSSKIIVLDSKRAVSILDTRSLWYYIIQQQQQQQQRLSNHYPCECLLNVIQGYANLRNNIQGNTTRSKDPYPLLEPNNLRKKWQKIQ